MTMTTQDYRPSQGHWQYEDFVRLPDDGKRYEIINGVLYTANSPTLVHQLTVGEVLFHLNRHTLDGALGVVLPAPFEVHLSKTTRPVQPDVLFVHKERQTILKPQYCDGAPDLIVEVISPSSIRLDRREKYDAYERYGVAEYWLVDPKLRGVEVHKLENGEYVLLGQYTGEELIESTILAGLEIKANSLFYPALPVSAQP